MADINNALHFDRGWLAKAAAAMAIGLAGCASVPPQAPAPVPTAPAAPTAPTSDVPPPAPESADVQALRELLAVQDRLYRVTGPLLVNNAELCRAHARNLLGFRAKNRHSYSAALSDAAAVVLGVNERLRVTDVLPGSGAASAGLQSGDVLLTVDGKNFPAGDKAEREAATLLGPLVAKRSALKLKVLRGAQEITFDVPLTRACAFNVDIGHADLVNAYGDGYRVLITRGMLGAVRDDEELAYVIAKEMAHNILGHAARLNQQATAGGIIDNLVRPQPDLSTAAGMSGLRPLPPEFDTAADRLSIYLLARAGYKLEQVVPFWRRIATEYPASAPNAYTALHPATERRLGSLEQAVRDVRAKRAANRPLVPAP